MKLVLILWISFSTVLWAHGQRFEIVEGSEIYKANIGEQVVIPLKIKNTSNKPLHILIKRTGKIIGTSQQTYFSWGSETYGTDINELPLSKRIEPGETSVKFSSVLETGLVAGVSTVKYLIYDKENPADAIEYEVNYLVDERTNNKMIYDSKEVKIKDLYPNPVSDYAIVDYTITDENINAKILIHNVLGSPMGEYKLPYLENRVKINTEAFNSGVYFYTLYIDNEGILTRKLVIRK